MKRIAALTITLTLLQLLALGGCKTVARALNNSGTLFLVDLVPDEKHAAADIADRSVKVLRSRLNAIGIDGEVKYTGGNRLEVKIYGAPDLVRVRDFLFKTYKLEFRKVVSPPSPHPVEMFPDEEKAKASAVAGQQVLPYSEREDASRPQYLILESDPIVTGEYIRSADAVSRSGSDHDYQIGFSLNSEGANKLGDWTAKNINNYLAVVLDGKVESVAFIRSQISDSGEISGMFSKAEAEEIARVLGSGYMPWKLRVVEERKF